MRLRSVLTLCACITVNVNAQELTPLDQLPSWAQERFAILAKRDSLEISTRINPFVWRGDFDGDGRNDLAVLVKHSRTKKEGIAILPRKGTAQFIGAGKEFGNAGDDFTWIDLWYVEDRSTLQTSYYEKPVRLTVDGLIVAKEASASALIYLQKGKPKWQQQGD